jgi:hypothetical protein
MPLATPTYDELQACVEDEDKFTDGDDIITFVNIAPCAFDVAENVYPPKGTDFDLYQG